MRLCLWPVALYQVLKTLGAIGVGDKTTITQVASTGVAGSGNTYREGDFGRNSPAYQRPSTSSPRQEVNPGCRMGLGHKLQAGGPSRMGPSFRRQANKKIDKLAGVMYRIL